MNNNWSLAEESSADAGDNWSPLCRVQGSLVAGVSRFELDHVAERSEIDLLDAFVARSIWELGTVPLPELTDLLGFAHQEFCRESVDRLVEMGAAQFDGGEIRIGSATQQLVEKQLGGKMETICFETLRLPSGQLEAHSTLWTSESNLKGGEKKSASRKDIEWLRKHLPGVPPDANIIAEREVTSDDWRAFRPCVLEFGIPHGSDQGANEISARELRDGEWHPTSTIPEDAIRLLNDELQGQAKSAQEKKDKLPKAEDLAADQVVGFYRADQAPAAMLKLIQEAREEIVLLFPFVSWAAKQFVQPLEEFLNRGGRVLILWGIASSLEEDTSQRNHRPDVLKMVENLEKNTSGIACVRHLGKMHVKIAMADKRLYLSGSHNLLSFAGRLFHGEDRVRLEVTNLHSGSGMFKFLRENDRDFLNPLIALFSATDGPHSTSELSQTVLNATWLAAFGKLDLALDLLKRVDIREMKADRFWIATKHLLHAATTKLAGGEELNPNAKETLHEIGALLGEVLDNEKQRKRLRRLFKKNA